MNRNLLFLSLFLVFGCASKTRNIDVDGMYASDLGYLAIGSVNVMSTSKGEESVILKYAEDTAWLSPSTKTRSLSMMFTGTNAVNVASNIVSCLTGPIIKGESK